MEINDMKWPPLVIEEPTVLMRFHHFKFIASFENDCEFLMALLDLMERQQYSGDVIKPEILDEDRHSVERDENGKPAPDACLPVECVFDEHTSAEGSKDNEAKSKREAVARWKKSKKAQLAEDPVNKVQFSCYNCRKRKFDTEIELKDHFAVEHPEDKPFKCRSCDECFSEMTELKDHATELRHHIFRCEECGKNFYTANNFKLHNQRWHGTGEKLYCSQCGRRFYLKTALRRHIRNIHPTVYPCQYCNEFQSESDKAHEEHLRLFHPNEKPKRLPRSKSAEIRYSCRLCASKTLETADSLKDHFERYHPEDKPFKCPGCPKLFPELLEMKRHMRTSKHKGPIPCEHCGKVMFTKQSLKDHIYRWHSDTKSFKCDICEKVFAVSAALHTHKQSKHLNPNRYGCELCDRRFQNLTLLREHKMMHQGMRHACKICGKKYKSRSGLSLHIKYTHVQVEKTIPCQVCGKLHKTLAELKSHMQIHDPTRVRSFSCNQCDKTFLSKQHMNGHIKKNHLKIRDHVCEVCSKAFSTSMNLKTHIRIHTGERPYRCPLCPSDFSQSGSLLTHVKLKHKGFKVSMNQFDVTVKMM